MSNLLTAFVISSCPKSWIKRCFILLTMKTLLHAALVSILFLSFAGNSFSSERGGNTGGNEELEKAVYENQSTGRCSPSANICSIATKYLNDEYQCLERQVYAQCDFYEDVKTYSSNCCVGI